MRVTAETKEKTRAAILREGRRLFARQGFEETSTRALARAAGIATGTLFNYFPTKEALALTLVAGAFEVADQEFCERRRGDESLDEDLFALVAAGLRQLEPCRAFVGAVLESALSPFRGPGTSSEADELQSRHLERVRAILHAHGVEDAVEIVSLHLYWTLHLGVLAFWSSDSSPRREETLVVLDRSMRLFADSLEPKQREDRHGS